MKVDYLNAEHPLSFCSPSMPLYLCPAYSASWRSLSCCHCSGFRRRQLHSLPQCVIPENVNYISVIKSSLIGFFSCWCTWNGLLTILHVNSIDGTSCTIMLLRYKLMQGIIWLTGSVCGKISHQEPFGRKIWSEQIKRSVFLATKQYSGAELVMSVLRLK